MLSAYSCIAKGGPGRAQSYQLVHHNDNNTERSLVFYCLINVSVMLTINTPTALAVIVMY